MLATTILSSSIFSRPDSDSRELTFVEAGQDIMVLGQSRTGHWLYVRDQERITGYIYAPRVDWPGDIETLPVIEAPVVATATRTPTSSTCQGADCPPLTFDIYPLPGSRCQGDIVYRTVFMRGQGGNGVYTYYWNGVKMAGPLTNKGFGFEVNNLDGATVIGTGKVVSGDGQVVEEELFVSGFICNN
jgi:hypothetical protein